MANTITIEIETAIRNVSWASVQVGQKSLHRVSVDFDLQQIRDQFLTGKTKILGLEIESVRDRFKVERAGFVSNERAHFTVSGQTASALVLVVAINYKLDFEVTPNSITLSGHHDGYPSYNVSVNGSSVYDCVQGTLPELAGDSDVKVRRRSFKLSSNGKPIGSGI